MTMSVSKGKDAPRGENHVAMDLMRRFNPSSDADGNASLACDPSGFASVSEEAKESVDYERPSFNWPAKSTPESNYFVIDSMAMDTLRRSGFAREARSLKTRSTFATPAYSDLPTLLHHYLDFAPAASLEGPDLEEFKRLAEKMGLDVQAALKARKKNIRNPLAHPSMPLQNEWEWLVENAGVVSQFGKSAACELSAGAMVELSSRWLDDIASGAPALPADDPSFANRAWFEARFPQGWSRVDHLHESAIVSAGLRFEHQMTVLLYELASKSARGFEAEETARFAFNHLNTVGINGAAVIATTAYDYLDGVLAPALAKARQEPGSSALARFLVACNPGLDPITDQAAVWIAYRHADPEGCATVEAARVQAKSKDGKNASANAKHEAQALAAELQRIELSVPSLALAPGEAPPAPPRGAVFRV